MARDFSSQSPFLLASFFVIPQDADSRSASASPYPIFLTNNGTAESPKHATRFFTSSGVLAVKHNHVGVSFPRNNIWAC